MHPMIESFMQRPRSHKVGFWVGSILLLAFIFWQYFYSGVLTQNEELNNKVNTLTTEITNERRLAQNLKKFRAEVKDLDIRLNQALQQLPDKSEIPDFLKSISDLAKEAGLEVSLFRPQPERFREFYAEVPVSIAVEGTYHQVATFFDEVGRLSRIVNINDIGFREPVISKDREMVTVKADCVATTFRYLDESERIQLEDAGAGDAKKRRRK